MQAEAAAGRPPSLDLVLTLVASVYDISHRDLARRRSNRVARPRAIAIYLAHTILSMSFSDLAGAFRRHRTTVFYAVRRIEALRDEDPKIDQLLGWLEGVLLSGRELAQ